MGRSVHIRLYTEHYFGHFAVLVGPWRRMKIQKSDFTNLNEGGKAKRP